MLQDRPHAGVRSVLLALDVLEAVAFSGEELGVTQVAERLNVTKGSVHRHLLTLVERGYLVQNPFTTKYALGPKSRLLARLAPDPDLFKLARAVSEDATNIGDVTMSPGLAIAARLSLPRSDDGGEIVRVDACCLTVLTPPRLGLGRIEVERYDAVVKVAT